jgi:hypothetical protein
MYLHKGNTLQTFFSPSYSLFLNLLIAPFPSFYKVTTLEDQVRALQQRIDNQDKKLENIKRETERRYIYLVYGKRDALVLFQ